MDLCSNTSISQLERRGGPIGAGEYGPRTRQQNQLYDLPVKVSDHVYSAIGATQPPTYKNAGHNNNLSLVIGSESVLVVNGGANNALARALHAEIKGDRPSCEICR